LVVVERGLVGDVGSVDIGGADLHQLRPFHDPHFGEFLSAQEIIDECVTLLRSSVRDEFFTLLKCGREADNIEEGAAEESFVRGEAGRNDAELVELLCDQVVDVVERLVFGALIFEAGGDDDGLGTLCEGVESAEEEGLAALGGG